MPTEAKPVRARLFCIEVSMECGACTLSMKPPKKYALSEYSVLVSDIHKAVRPYGLFKKEPEYHPLIFKCNECGAMNLIRDPIMVEADNFEY